MVDFYARFETDREQGGFVVTFPDLGHGATQGETFQEAAEMALDLLRCIIGELIKRGKDIPAPLKHRGKGYLRVVLPALETAKLELYSAFRSSGIKKAELARRIGIPQANIDRLFDFDHASRLDQLEAALRAVGKRIEVRVSDAA